MVKYIVAAAMLCAALSGCATRQPLFAGTAKVDISPDQPVMLAPLAESFRLPDVLPATKTPPDNIHDPLYARVVVLKNKNISLAIVSVDLMLFSSKRVIDEAKKQYGLDYVILSATHNHSGMIPRGLSPTGKEQVMTPRGLSPTGKGQAWSLAQADPGESLDWPGFSEDPWYAATEDKIIAAIGEATRNLFPARIAAGKGPYESAYLGHNIRIIRPAQGVAPEVLYMTWDNPSRIPTKPTDPTVGVIRIEDEAGKPRALMVHYACHPVTMMGGPMITADFPGAMVDYVEEQLGDSCMAMFLQGASGDINPYEICLRGAYGFNMMRQSGVALGKAALGVSKELPSPKDPKVAVRIKENMVNIPHSTGDKSSTACITTVVFNRDLALVTIPGEMYVQHQLNLTEKSPVPNTFILGNAYCGQGSPFLLYIPTVQAAKEGGYGANQCSFVSADAGDRMVNAAVISIGK